MIYERVIQWATGPVSALVGVVATKVVHASISHSAAVNVATFVTTTAATYLAHAKWLANLVQWWKHTEAPLSGTITSTQIADGTITASGPERLQNVEQEITSVLNRAESLRAQLRAHGLEPLA